ncbi:MAG: penicillin-binding protein [Corynebacteriales bacterium]|nr:penicillin-binding protein [Mycobacteriales bacterium]
MTEQPTTPVLPLWRRATKRKWPLAIGAGIVALAVGITSFVACQDDQGAELALDKFLTEWRAGKLGPEYKTLAGDLADSQPKLKADEISINGSKADAKVHVEWTLGQDEWRYDTTVKLTQAGENWKVDFSPSTVHPKLTKGSSITVARDAHARGDILDNTGQPIMTLRPVVRVGVVPKNVTDAQALANQLGTALSADGIDTSDLPARVEQAGPEQFVEVVTLRRERYDEIKSSIYDLPGVQFVEAEQSLAPNRDFARALLGTVGPVTKEMMDENPGRYVMGDDVGRAGIQQYYDNQLAGSPGTTVSITGGKKDVKLATFKGKSGDNLKLGLDIRAQTAADAAVAQESRTSAMVAIRISDGAILAAANGPSGSGVNLAFEGATAPGSTFKMVSALGLLEAGVRPDDIVSCPKIATVEGRNFMNDNDFELGDVPFHTDFAKSCNTAFVNLAPKLGDDGLVKASEKLGIGTDWKLGPDINPGSVQSGGSATEKAAAIFGQGKTSVSPLSMAGATAAVARGQWKQPQLVLDPAQSVAAPGPELAHVDELKSMMCEVVTDGSATALRDAPGGQVCGKTGTAEFGDVSEGKSHGWFVGFQGDIAFAVFVENGGSSAPAVAITENFLRGLN